MSRLRIQRGSLRRNFTRAYNEFKEEKEKAGDENPDALRLFWRRLEDRYHQLTKIDEEILQEMRESDVSQDEMDAEYETIQEYRDKWNDLGPSENVFTQEENRSMASIVSSRNEKSRYKLPKLNLVEFNGSPR